MTTELSAQKTDKGFSLLVKVGFFSFLVIAFVVLATMAMFPEPWRGFGWALVTALKTLLVVGTVYFIGRGFIWLLAKLVVVGNGYADLIHKWRMQRITEHNAALLQVDHKSSLVYAPGREVVIEARPIGYLQTGTQTITPQVETLPRLLDVLQPEESPVIFVGPMRSGKTTNAVSIAYALNLPTLFIAKKYETRNHYQNMTVYSEEQRAGSVERGVAAALKAIEDYTPQIIFIDDLINVQILCGDITPLMAEIATMSASHNKRVFFTVQATDKESMGLGKFGAQLKNNFMVVEVPPPIKDSNLQPISHAQIGTLYESGDWKSGEQVRLPGPVSFAPVDPEQQFIKDAQTMSNRQLCTKYYGSINGTNYAKLKTRLQAHGLDG